jgi:hypothetical protein
LFGQLLHHVNDRATGLLIWQVILAGRQMVKAPFQFRLGGKNAGACAEEQGTDQLVTSGFLSICCHGFS